MFKPAESSSEALGKEEDCTCDDVIKTMIFNVVVIVRNFVKAFLCPSQLGTQGQSSQAPLSVMGLFVLVSLSVNLV